MLIKCVQCGKEFEAKRSDAQFCSDACRKAHKRQTNLTFNGVLIRGQHENDIPPTGLGIEMAHCKSCGKPYSRWIEAKMARLVRNEVEGSVQWGSANDFDRAAFDVLMSQRKAEWVFCSDECAVIGAKPLNVSNLKVPEVTHVVVEAGSNGQLNHRPKRRGA